MSRSNLKINKTKLTGEELNAAEVPKIRALGEIKIFSRGVFAICFLIAMYAILMYLLKDSTQSENLLSNFRTLILAAIAAMGGYMGGRSSNISER